MNQGNISALQMALLLFQSVLGSSVLLMPSITTQLSGRDMWLTPVLSVGVGYLVVWLAFRLYRLSPDGTFGALLEAVFGKAAGKSLGLLFILFQLHILAFVARDYSEFIVLNFYFKTPVVIVLAGMILLCVWVVRHGIEVLARCGQLFVPVITIITLLVFGLLLPDLDPGLIFPLFEKGAGPALKGSVVVDGWFCQLFLILYLLPRIKDKKAARRWGYWSVTAIGFVMLSANLTILMLLGDSTSHYIYPVLTAARYIALADFFEHVEATVMMVWVLGEFIKISLNFFVVAVGLSQLLQLKKSDALVVPLGFVLLLLCFRAVKDYQTLAAFISTTGTIYILIGYVLFPFLVYMSAVVKKTVKGTLKVR